MSEIIEIPAVSTKGGEGKTMMVSIPAVSMSSSNTTRRLGTVFRYEISLSTGPLHVREEGGGGVDAEKKCKYGKATTRALRSKMRRRIEAARLHFLQYLETHGDRVPVHPDSILPTGEAVNEFVVLYRVFFRKRDFNPRGKYKKQVGDGDFFKLEYRCRADDPIYVLTKGMSLGADDATLLRLCEEIPISQQFHRSRSDRKVA